MKACLQIQTCVRSYLRRKHIYAWALIENHSKNGGFVIVFAFLSFLCVRLVTVFVYLLPSCLGLSVVSLVDVLGDGGDGSGVGV